HRRGRRRARVRAARPRHRRALLSAGRRASHGADLHARSERPAGRRRGACAAPRGNHARRGGRRRRAPAEAARMTDVLALDRGSLAFEGGDVLQDASLTVAPGELIVVAGPSGAGKSSLLRVVLGLAAPASGNVWLRGEHASAPGRVIVPPEERALAVV